MDKTNCQFADVVNNYNKGNKILFSRNSSSLNILLELIRKQSHLTLSRWALFFTDKIVNSLPEVYQNDVRINDATRLAKKWFAGKIKMNEAKRAILNVHQIAKETTDKEVIAKIHAIGQGLATIHVETHAIGLVIYYLTALVHHYGIAAFINPVCEQIDEYQIKLIELSTSPYTKDVAGFITKSKPNKEQLLFEKTKK